MLKNNLKALLIHIIIGILNFFIFIMFHSSVAKWVSEEAARRHHYFMLKASIVVMVLSLILYYGLSRLFCLRQKGVLRNIASFSSVAVIGIILWIPGFVLAPAGAYGSMLNSRCWLIYSIYNDYALFFIDETNLSSPYGLLIFSFLPAVMMYAGMKRKAVKQLNKS